MRASSHVLYFLFIAESTETKQVYGVKLDFVSERTIKDHHHQGRLALGFSEDNKPAHLPGMERQAGNASRSFPEAERAAVEWIWIEREREREREGERERRREGGREGGRERGREGEKYPLCRCDQPCTCAEQVGQLGVEYLGTSTLTPPQAHA